MKVWVENYNEAKIFEPPGKTIALRVFDPDAVTHELESSIWESDYPGDRWDNCPQAPFPSEKYLAVFGYTFEDIDMDHNYSEHVRKALIRDTKSKLFNANIAERIVRDFVSVYKDADAMMVHCHAGISRSPAIANALNDSFQLDADWQGVASRFEGCVAGLDYVGNSYVYRLICEAVDRLGV